MTSRSVQELSMSGQEVPQNYIYKDSDGGSFDASLLLMEIPIVDMALLTSPSSSKQELEKLRSDLTSWGCFQAINHGIETELLDELRDVTRQFFALPQEKKQKYSREDGSLEGYGNDMILFENQTLDWIDRLYLTVSPEDQRQLKYWPETPETFREILHQYTKNIEVMTEVILKAMARSINLDENSFLDMHGEKATLLARFNFYPPCPRPDAILGLKPHADGSALTVLLQDKQVEGLQFLKDNQWYRVPIIPEALVVNVGDQIEIMSNGIFKSPTHRAVTNRESERISVVLFSTPNSDREIEPVDGLVDETRPRLYKKLKDYPSFFFRYYQRGERPIEAAKV